MRLDKKNGFFKTFEDFKKDTATQIEETFLQVKKDVESWFQTGSLSMEKDVHLSECLVNTGTTQPTLTFEFSGPNNYYEVTLKGDMTNLANEEEDKLFLLELKTFDTEQAELLRRKEQEVTLEEFTEDFFLQLIANTEAEPS